MKRPGSRYEQEWKADTNMSGGRGNEKNIAHCPSPIVLQGGATAHCPFSIANFLAGTERASVGSLARLPASKNLRLLYNWQSEMGNGQLFGSVISVCCRGDFGQQLQ